MAIQYGSYTGNGAANQTVNVAITPALVFVIGGAAVDCAAKATSTGGTVSMSFVNGTYAASGISALAASSFTVGSSFNVSSTTYYYAVLDTNNDYFAHGSYTGTGAAQAITTSLTTTPEVILIFETGGRSSLAFHTNKGVNNAALLNNALDLWRTSSVTSVGSGSFSLGNDSATNTNTTVYYYLAFATNPNNFARGMYNGNGVDDRTITAGMNCHLVFIEPMSNASISLSRFANVKHELMGSNNSLQIASGFAGNFIQQTYPERVPDFQVGNDSGVNTGSFTPEYPWWALGGGLVILPDLDVVNLPPIVPTWTSNILPFSPYTRYKNMRAAMQIVNNVRLGP